MPEPSQRDTNLSTAVKLAEMGRDMVYVKETVNSINDKVSHGYVTKEEFYPIKRMVYTTITALILSVVGAIGVLLTHQGGK